MQDRFKLRVWNDEDNCMCDVSEIDFVGGVVSFQYEFKGEIITTSTALKNVDLIQCTGGRDKNDKLIYAGDIFAIESEGSYIIGVVKYDDEYARFYIHEYGAEEEWNGLYDETKKGYFEKCDFDEYNFVDGKINLEIIGNEYENPELFNLEVPA